MVTLRTQAVNQDGATVVVYKRSVFIYKKGAPQEQRYWPDPGRPIEEL
jgi:hypothetical protein